MACDVGLGLIAGGFVPALVFGVAFGNLLQGVPFELNELSQATYTGSFFALLNPLRITLRCVKPCNVSDSRCELVTNENHCSIA